jgi:hypothetical protein
LENWKRRYDELREKYDGLKRFQDCIREYNTFKKFVQRVAYEPIGEPEATDKKILATLTKEARALLRGEGGDG